MANPAPAYPTLDLDKAKAAAQRAMEIFEAPANKERITAAIESAEGDMMKVRMALVPLSVELQAPVLTEYGFPADMMGLMAIVSQIRMQAASDDALKALVVQIETVVLGAPLTT